MDSGDVASCLLDGPGGTNAQRGLGEPPFPTIRYGDVLPWITLRKGDTGPMVVQVQVALVENGASLAADGDFGSITEAAVIAFQKAQGLKRTGAVNELTAAALGVERRESSSFPPQGWIWSGWGYNGSPALASWETDVIQPTRAVPGFSAGRVRGNVAVIGLFEGFMTDITALGYSVNDIAGYVYRCTSGTGKTCQGRTSSSLSNHAYGVAIDINTAANPEIDYQAANGVSACAVPMRTDMPRALIRAAEKWGLYWGGYGWYGGCSSPDEWMSSVHRDPMHFEYRGDAFMAAAIVAHNTGAPIPKRWCGELLEVSDNRGAGFTSTCGPGAKAPTDRVLAIRVGADDAVAAAVSITTSGTSGGSVRATSCTGRLRWRTLADVSASSTSVGTLLPLSEGRACITVPADATVRITRTALWSESGQLGLVPSLKVRTVTPASDGTVAVEGPADAVWVTSSANTSRNLAARSCSDPTQSGRSVKWVSRDGVEALQVVPVTSVDGVGRWCANATDVDVAHVARFTIDGGFGLTPAVRTVRGRSDLSEGTTGVVVQVRPRSAPMVIGACDGDVQVRSRTVDSASQVSTVFLPTKGATSLCVTGDGKVTTLAVAGPAATTRMLLSGPKRLSVIRS